MDPVGGTSPNKLVYSRTRLANSAYRWPMGWEFTADIETYAEKVRALLTRDPVRNTVPLTVLGGLRSGGMGERTSDEPILLAWYDGPPYDWFAYHPTGPDDPVTAAEVRGAVLMTPPYELLLAVVPEEGVADLVDALRTHGAVLPGVNGDVGVVEEFSAAWLDGTGRRAEVSFRTRLYGLDVLVEPSPPPPGRPRRAIDADADLAMRWFLAFHDEAGMGQGDVAWTVRDRIADGRIWLWEDEGGEVVSLAARQRPAVGVARIGPVYTPPEHRRRGFAAAVTATCTRDALEHADQVVLFTDLANPTSNSIYQQLGYRPVTDRTVARFVNQ